MVYSYVSGRLEALKKLCICMLAMIFLAACMSDAQSVQPQIVLADEQQSLTEIADIQDEEPAPLSTPPGSSEDVAS